MNKEQVKQILNEKHPGYETVVDIVADAVELSRQVTTSSLIKCPVCYSRGQIFARDDGLIPVDGNGVCGDQYITCPACESVLAWLEIKGD